MDYKLRADGVGETPGPESTGLTDCEIDSASSCRAHGVQRREANDGWHFGNLDLPDMHKHQLREGNVILHLQQHQPKTVALQEGPTLTAEEVAAGDGEANSPSPAPTKGLRNLGRDAAALDVCAVKNRWAS